MIGETMDETMDRDAEFMDRMFRMLGVRGWIRPFDHGEEWHFEDYWEYPSFGGWDCPVSEVIHHLGASIRYECDDHEDIESEIWGFRLELQSAGIDDVYAWSQCSAPGHIVSKSTVIGPDDSMEDVAATLDRMEREARDADPRQLVECIMFGHG